MKSPIRTIINPNILYDIYKLNFQYVRKNGLYDSVLKKRKKTENDIKTNAQNHSAKLEYPIGYKGKKIQSEIKRLTEAYDQGCIKYKGELSIDFIVGLHELIEPDEIYSTMAEVKPHRIRADGDRITEMSTNTPEKKHLPTYYGVEKKLKDVFSFLNESNEFYKPRHFLDKKYSDPTILTEELKKHQKLTTVERALLAHFHIVGIHPFFEGNGRVARTTQDIMLYKSLLMPATIKDSERGFYMDLLIGALIEYQERTRKENYWEKIEKTTYPEQLRKFHYSNVGNTEKYFFNYLASKVLNNLKKVLNI